MTLKCEINAKTDVGRQRFRNEDNFVVMDDFSLAIVADGMGGHVDGDVASKIVVQTLKDRYENLYETALQPYIEKPEEYIEQQKKFLTESIQAANFKIFEKNQGIFSLDSMGTTVVGLQITSSGHFITACVGDSRIYRIREEKIEQVTEDHSLVGELIRYNIIQEKDLMFLQTNKNIITRALGMGQSVEVDIKIEKTLEGDIFLLCSDGLTDLVENDQILKIVLDADTIETAIKNLIKAANEAGGLDNITVALVRVFE